MKFYKHILLLLFLFTALYESSAFAFMPKVFAKAQSVNDSFTNSASDNVGDMFNRLLGDNHHKSYEIFIRYFLYICSFGFFIATVLKFKQYKDNPTQIPISTPFVLLLVTILAATASDLVKPVKKSLFGDMEVTCSGLPGSPGCD